MKIKLILLSLFISCSLIAQKTKKVKVKDKKDDTIEIYYVLKSNYSYQIQTQLKVEGIKLFP